jgi:hypothetical protein
MYVSAKYATEDPTMPIAPEGQKPVHATDGDGVVWTLSEDSEVGDWLDYLANGGTIDPADIPVDKNITSAPTNLTGGPTIAELFNAQP